MRFAFITPEFPTEYGDGGGLGSYLLRMCQVLLAEGHVPEVFVSSSESGRIDLNGIVVHRVSREPWAARADRLARAADWLPKGGYAFRCSAGILAQAAALASAFKTRESQIPFDFVQSADFLAVGLFVPRRKRRPHVVRCSCAADLWSEADGSIGFNQWQCYWERKSIARADKAYAPSRLVADHYRNQFGLDVHVVRPPLGLAPTTEPVPDGLAVPQSRFHFHFGQLKRRKGTEFLAEALPLVWRDLPDYQMVWAGNSLPDYFTTLRSHWGEHADKVSYLGPTAKPVIYEILKRADASVLPSLVDNLPNTVIESLLFDTPVIGTYGSSVDEIVVDGRNGRLVEFGNCRALADAIIESWRSDEGQIRGLASESPIWDEMQPNLAVSCLLELAELVSPEPAGPGSAAGAIGSP